MLQLRNAPRLARDDLLMTRTDQQQIRQHRHTKGLLDPSFLLTDLVLAQPEIRLQLAVDLFHGPSSLVGTHHLSRDPLVQIGHQNFRLLRAEVTPSFTQNHGDVTDVPQTQACAIHPESFAPWDAWQAWHPDALIIFARQMRYQIFDGLILDRFPCPGYSEDEAPAPGRIVDTTLLDHFDIVLGTIGCVAFHDDRGGPRGRSKRPDHLPEQRILRL